MPWTHGDEDRELVEIEVPPGCSGECDVPVVRRVEGAAEQSRHWTSRTSPSTSTSSPLRAPAAFSAAASSSSSSGTSPGDPEASVGAQDPEAAATRTRPVDEEVDEPVLRGLLRLLGRTELEERTLQLVDAFARRARDAEHTHDPVVLELEGRRLCAEVDLVQDDRLWALLELGAVRGELVIDRRETLDGIVFRRVDHVQQKIRALEVREEFVTEPDSLARTLDQARHVGNGQLTGSIRGIDRAEDRRERRERIVGDLRLRIRDAREQRRLAGVGQPGECGVGKQLEPEIERRFLTREARLRKPRCPACRRCEALVAAARSPTARGDHLRAGRRQICDHLLVLVEHLRSDGDP